MNILLVEGSTQAADLEDLVGALEPHCTVHRVGGEEALLDALMGARWDVCVLWDQPDGPLVAATRPVLDAMYAPPTLVLIDAEATDTSTCDAWGVLPPLPPATTAGLLLAVGRQHLRQRALWMRQERYELALEASGVAIWEWEIDNNEILYSTGNDELLDGDIHALRQEIACQIGGAEVRFASERRVTDAEGNPRWTMVRGIALRDESGVPYRMAGAQTDITAERQAVPTGDRLDGLTGLPNRRGFMELLDRAFYRAIERDTPCAVLYVDLDRFKVVNESLGHGSGDELLVRVARRIGRCLRAGDVVARLHGDEFAILAEHLSDPSEVGFIAKRVVQEVCRPMELRSQEVFTDASVGIATLTPHTKEPGDLLRDAETAMHRAKGTGTTRVAFFEQEMHHRSLAWIRLDADLRRAIEREEFELHYQPIVDLVTGKISSFEALIRWNHPERGRVSPIEFIPMAEETGLILPMGDWVLAEAARQIRSWRDRFPHAAELAVSVNLSARQFAVGSVVQQVAETLRTLRLDASALRLEITEHTVMDRAETAIALLQDFKRIGVQIQIDDFGTGYSSLNYLTRFPVDTLKIDRSFIHELGVDTKRTQVVRTIVALAHGLNLHVVAEGLETPDQLEHIRRLGVRYGQGYLFSRPLDAEAATRLIAEHMWILSPA